MHDFPLSVFATEDGCHAQIVLLGAPLTEALVCSIATVYARSPLAPAAIVDGLTS